MGGANGRERPVHRRGAGLLRRWPDRPGAQLAQPLAHELRQHGARQPADAVHDGRGRAGGAGAEQRRFEPRDLGATRHGRRSALWRFPMAAAVFVCGIRSHAGAGGNTRNRAG
ncbi:hypothetical protein G6F56_014350 [Rhizopus delemar]|nr:hypothetical protein G6F56_014350 [Rhizopus delemar]